MSERKSYRKMKASSVFSQKAVDAFGVSLHSTRICCYSQQLDFSSSFSNSSKSRVSIQPNFRTQCSIAGSFPDNLHQRRFVSFKVHASAAGAADQPKWWEKNVGSNMIDIHSTQEFLGALSQAGDRLVIVEFYGTWCASCRALFPKICKFADEHPEILFLKVNFDENKSLCKSLNVKVLPYFQLYRGADGLLESFPCSLAKENSSYYPPDPGQSHHQLCRLGYEDHGTILQLFCW